MRLACEWRGCMPDAASTSCDTVPLGLTHVTAALAGTPRAAAMLALAATAAARRPRSSSGSGPASGQAPPLVCTLSMMPAEEGGGAGAGGGAGGEEKTQMGLGLRGSVCVWGVRS